MTSESGALLEIRNLKKHFRVGGGMFGSMTGKKEYLKAVDGISLSIEPGTTYGLVGESGQQLLPLELINPAKACTSA